MARGAQQQSANIDSVKVNLGAGSTLDSPVFDRSPVSKGQLLFACVDDKL